MKQAFDFLIDISEKMDKKLSVTTRVLTDEIIPNLDDSQIFGMRTFLSVVKNPIIINSLDLGINSKIDFKKKAESLPIPNGGAPIAEAIKESLAGLKNVEADVKNIILITSGEETDGSVYEYEVERNAGNVHVNIIGIAMREQDMKSAEKVALMTGGVFCNVPADKATDGLAISSILAPIVDVLKGRSVVAPATPKVEPQVVVPVVEKTVEVASTPVATPIVEVAEKKPIEVKSVNFAAADDLKPIVVEKAVQEDLDAVGEMNATNAAIRELLVANESLLKKVLKNNEATEKEVQDLRVAAEKNMEAMAQLKQVNADAATAIEQLKQVISEKEDEILALESGKSNLQVAIDQLIEREKNVVIDLDSAAREEISKQSEAYLFDYLEKKYPNRVKWCNQNGKQKNGYDFEIVDYENNVTEYYIACKGAKDDTSTFFLTEKEWNLCLENNLNYQVYLVRNITSNPKVIMIDNLIGWMMAGKVRPGALKNEKVKAGQVMLTLVK